MGLDTPVSVDRGTYRFYNKALRAGVWAKQKTVLRLP